jgi:hypothetical protein
MGGSVVVSFSNQAVSEVGVMVPTPRSQVEFFRFRVQREHHALLYSRPRSVRPFTRLRVVFCKNINSHFVISRRRSPALHRGHLRRHARAHEPR